MLTLSVPWASFRTHVRIVHRRGLGVPKCQSQRYHQPTK
ncbi:MAG: CRISPR-associated protein Cas5 [Actinobacteria bacterium]|nr:CRISPR-associated protein Cas5 [Actinomycetota bacterium]